MPSPEPAPAIRYSVEEIADRLAIYDHYARYVHYADRSDIDALDTLFFNECEFDYSEGGAPNMTWVEYRETEIYKGGPFWRVMHVFTNLLITFREDGTAHVMTKTTSPMILKSDVTDGAAGKFGEQKYEIFGGYEDVLVRDGAGWRFLSRKWHNKWVTSTNGFTEFLAVFGEG